MLIVFTICFHRKEFWQIHRCLCIDEMTELYNRHYEESLVDPVGGNVGVKSVGSEGWRCWPSIGAVGR